jgi:Family of unknown function (DUF6065)
MSQENSSTSAPASPLKIDFFQIVDDQLMAKHRTDGCGFELRWADVRRQWMDDTPNAFAYRCLPLTIANQLGWHITCPVGFTAFWRGSPAPGHIDFTFDRDPGLWKTLINDQFGQGIITWNTPFLVRTKPVGTRLLVTGPANYFRPFAHPLMAVIETDWLTASFTMNYKLSAACESVRFEAGEPLMQLIPMGGNVYADLENAKVTYQRLVDDPQMQQKYVDWSNGRREFHQAKAAGQVKPDDWQRDYFRGRDIQGNAAPTHHATKLKPPRMEGR